MSPSEHFVRANRIRHHVLEWGEGPRTVVLAHGYLDQAFSFDAVARGLVARGLRVLAADFRGHGETDWVGAGGYYHFPDYTLDLEAWTRALGVEVFDLVGHSMGGTVATMFAAIRPERVRTLVSVEGLGPPASSLADAPRRFGHWFDAVARTEQRVPRPIASLDEALQRLRAMHPSLPDSLGLALAARATKPHPSGEGLAWRFDPLHQTPSPTPFRTELYESFLGRIAAPTLVVLGEKGMRLEDEEARIARIAGARTLEMPGQGHMIHWHAPEPLAAAIADHVLATPA